MKPPPKSKRTKPIPPKLERISKMPEPKHEDVAQYIRDQSGKG